MKKRTRIVSPLNADFIAQMEARDAEQDLQPALAARPIQIGALADIKPCPVRSKIRVARSQTRGKRASGAAPGSVRGQLPGIHTDAGKLAAMLLVLGDPRFADYKGVFRTVAGGVRRV